MPTKLPDHSHPPRFKAVPFSPIGVTPADGIIEAVSALTGNVDLDKEMFADTAFDDTILGWKSNIMRLPMGADHEAALGVTLEMERISRSDLPKKARDAAPDATGGLWCKGQVVMMPAQLKLLEAIQARVKAGDPPGSSVTFYSAAADEETVKVKGVDVTVLGKAAVVEWGPALRKRARNPGAAVLSAKSKEDGSPSEKAAAYLAGTYEERRAKVQDAIGASGMFEGREWYIEGTAPEYVVVVLWSEGSTLYTVVYYAEVNGVIVLGDSRPADVTLTLTMKAGEDGQPGETLVIEKAGRVLRRTLLDRLTRAMEELDAIRVAAKREEEEGDEDDDGDAGTGKKAGADPDADRELELDLSFLDLQAEAFGLQ